MHRARRQLAEGRQIGFRNSRRLQSVVRLSIPARRTTLENTIIGEFATRREAELAVEHVVQEYGVARGHVFVQPAGAANSSGTRPVGADAKTAPAPEPQQKLEGGIEVSVDFHGTEPEKIAKALKTAGAKTVRTK